MMLIERKSRRNLLSLNFIILKQSYNNLKSFLFFSFSQSMFAFFLGFVQLFNYMSTESYKILSEDIMNIGQDFLDIQYISITWQ